MALNGCVSLPRLCVCSCSCKRPHTLHFGGFQIHKDSRCDLRSCLSCRPSNSFVASPFPLIFLLPSRDWPQHPFVHSRLDPKIHRPPCTLQQQIFSPLCGNRTNRFRPPRRFVHLDLSWHPRLVASAKPQAQSRIGTSALVLFWHKSYAPATSAV